MSWQVDVVQRIAAPRDRVWDLYTDFSTWRRWAGVGPVRIERAGEASRFGPGCIRVMSGGVREEVVSADAPARLTYRVLSGVPMRDHLGEVLFTETSGGTEVRWRCRYQPSLPGTGLLFRVVVERVFRRALGGLARELTQ